MDGGSTNVSCQLKFRLFVSCQLNIWPFVCCQLISCKKTFTGLYTKWDSFPPRKNKINLIRTLTYRCFRICSSAPLLKSALEDLKKVLLKNGYPQGIILFNINDVLNRNKNKPNDPVQTVPPKYVIILLPYLGLHCHQITKRLKSCINNFYPFFQC